jgi:hypothetical protein
MFQQFTQQVLLMRQLHLIPCYVFAGRKHMLDQFKSWYFFTSQVCEKCGNVKFEREGYYITLDIEKGTPDGHVRPSSIIMLGLERVISSS